MDLIQVTQRSFAQGNTTSGMMVYSGNMMSNTNVPSTDECEENATADKCDTGNI